MPRPPTSPTADNSVGWQASLRLLTGYGRKGG